MDIHPIRNEKDYDMALAETEQLWGAIEGTKDGDKLDILLIKLGKPPAMLGRLA